MSTEQEEQVVVDPMIQAFFDGTEKQEEKSQEQIDAEAQQQNEANAEAERQRLEQEQESQKEAERLEQEKLAEAEKKQAESQQEKPKAWDEGLNDQAKFILDKLTKGEDKDVYELLKNKFGYENLTEEDKMITYLAEKNPHLNREDLLFKAAEEYGIGATYLSEEELRDLTDSQRKFLRTQEIERKGLLSQADKFFKDKSTNIEIPSLPNPLDTDEGYKEYKAFQAEQVKLKEQEEAQKIENEKLEQQTIQQVNTTAKEIEALTIELDIDLDQGKFDLKSEFKLDDKKQKQLADYALEYVPTQAEFKAHQDQDGKLDMKGYMTTLAHKLFASQIQKAVTKQAIMKDREKFTEEQLKNSTLRNNSNMSQADVQEAFEVSAMRQ